VRVIDVRRAVRRAVAGQFLRILVKVAGEKEMVRLDDDHDIAAALGPEAEAHAFSAAPTAHADLRPIILAAREACFDFGLRAKPVGQGAFDISLIQLQFLERCVIEVDPRIAFSSAAPAHGAFCPAGRNLPLRNNSACVVKISGSTRSASLTSVAWSR